MGPSVPISISLSLEMTMTESSVVACSATAAVGFLKLLAGFSVKLSDRSAISRESARTEKLVLK